MRKYLLALCAALLLLLDTAAADVNYRKFRMGYWKSLAKNCGETYQGYVANELEHLLPNIPSVMWEAARNEGAEEEEIEVLKKLFDEGRKLALDLPWVQSPATDPSQFFIDMKTEQAVNYMRYCTHRYFE